YAMIKRERSRHHRAPRDLAAVDGGLFNNSADPENPGFAGIEDRGEPIDAVGAEIGDGKSAARDVFELEMAGPGLFSQRLGLDGDLAQSLAGGSAYHRDDQSLAKRHRDAHVDFGWGYDLRTFQPCGHP